MALTKVTGQVIKNTTDVTVGVLTVTNTLAVGGTVSIGGTLTYEDVTNVDAVGLITARNGIVVGSGITLSKDGDIFATGVTTSTTFSGNFSGGTVSGTTGTFTSTVKSGTTATGIIFSAGDSGNSGDRVIQFKRAATTNDINIQAINSGTGATNLLFNNEGGAASFGGAISATTGTFTGDVDIADKIVHTGDTNTAIRFPDADTVTVETAGSEAIRITSDRDLGVGMGSPWARLVVHETSTNTDLTAHNYLASQSGMSIENGSTTDGCFSAYTARVKNNAGTQQSGSLAFKSVNSSYAPEIHLTQRTGAGVQATRLRISSTGKINIGDTQTSQNILNIEDGTAASMEFASHGTGGDTAYIGVKKSAGGGLTFGISNRDFIFKTGATYSSGTTFDSGTERLRINSDGRVLIGDDTAENTMGLNARVQTFGTDASTSSVAIRRGSNDAQAAFLVLSKSRNTSVGSRTILQNGDEVGNIFFAADDGTDLVSNTAAIKSQINGTPGANDTPGNLSFWTTADGANTAVQRMTIDSNGHVTKPYQFHIEVDRDSDQTGYNAGANFGTPMIFNRVVRTIGTQNSALDTSTGKITVPVAGVYFLEAAAYATTAAFGQGWFTEGSGRMNYSDHVHSGDTSPKTTRLQTSGMHYLAANTEVGYKPYGSGESNVTIGDSVYHTWMRVTLIG